MEDDEIAILSVATPQGKSTLRVPPSNTEFVYTAGRAFTFWPEVNGNNATWLEEEIAKLYANTDDENLTFKGKIVNADHTVGTGRKSIVIGVTTKEKYTPGVGVDVLNQLDRRLLDEHEINAEDFAKNGEYSKQSVEINCNRPLSKFIVMMKPNSKKLEDQLVYSSEEAAELGIRRTVPIDPIPYLHEGKYKVVEACVPRRIRGIAMLSNPADTTAEVYDIAASQLESAAVAQRTDDDYEDSSALDNAYKSSQPMSISNEDTDSMDDGAFAVVQGGEELAAKVTAPSVKVRELPLYESSKHHAYGLPNKGLIKAALGGLGKDKDGKRKYNRGVHSEALRRVRNAHSQLTGEYSMALAADEVAKIADPLNTTIATISEQLRVAREENASVKTAEQLLKEQVALKDTEIAALVAKIKNFEDEKAELASAEVASARLVELAKIDGFALADTEKAALVAVLKDESEADFKNRLLREENASLKRNIASGKPNGKAPDEQAALIIADEQAGLKALTGVAVTLPANSAFAKLFDK